MGRSVALLHEVVLFFDLLWLLWLFGVYNGSRGEFQIRCNEAEEIGRKQYSSIIFLRHPFIHCRAKRLAISFPFNLFFWF